MKEVFVCASIITAIILCFVGIIKLPFKKFKEKHSKWYRAVFCTLSLALSIAGPIIAQLFILNGVLQSVEFAMLISSTIGGVFGLYTSYEGLGLKQLVKIIVGKTAELFNTFNDAKLKKIVGNVGIEKLNEIAKKLETEEIAKQEKLVEEAPKPAVEQPAPPATKEIRF